MEWYLKMLDIFKRQIRNTFLPDIYHGWLQNDLYIWKLIYLCVFLWNTRGFFLSLKKNPTFSNIIPCAKHVLNTFKLRTLCARLYLFIIYILFAPIILTSTHCCVNNSHDIKVLMKVIKTETFNVGFISK